MNRVMGYADRWSVAPGDTVAFKVSCLGGEQFSSQIVGVPYSTVVGRPAWADYDNDGVKDLFISNGIERRPNDLEYIKYVSNPMMEMMRHTREKK